MRKSAKSPIWGIDTPIPIAPNDSRVADTQTFGGTSHEPSWLMCRLPSALLMNFEIPPPRARHQATDPLGFKGLPASLVFKPRAGCSIQCHEAKAHSVVTMAAISNPAKNGSALPAAHNTVC